MHVKKKNTVGECTVAVIGTGYVGMGLAIILRYLGHKVFGIDVRQEVVDQLNGGELPIFEPILDGLLMKYVGDGLTFTTDYGVLQEVDMVFICVGTPSLEDGSHDLSYLESAVRSIGEQLVVKKTHTDIVLKSTVPVGTTLGKVKVWLDEVAPDVSYELAFSPEYLRQGFAFEDTVKPRSIDIGTNGDEGIKDRFLEVFGRLITNVFSYYPGSSIGASLPEDFWRRKVPVNEMNITSAELTKLVANSLLATDPALMMEVSRISEELGADVGEIIESLKCDPRIGRHIIPTGGIGGSCFPKDVRSLSHIATKLGIQAPVLQGTIANMGLQPRHVVDAFCELLYSLGYPDLYGRSIGILGLTFKAGTDDLRDSPALAVIKILTSYGVFIHAFDPMYPKGSENPQLAGINLYNSIEGLFATSLDGLMLMTNWPVIVDVDLEFLSTHNPRLAVYDVYRCWDRKRAIQLGLLYQGLGTPRPK